ncbi:hypothetical protein BKA66DRAFT_118436 [Pyrenochaeta sp. MPI-SDFR-AT-0127]|nr:hypothetical protein BKA66DRAFT_118436 [Pyrenochaeta sp. MPI-SDFR-AT-0127]
MRPPSISPVTRTTWIICRHPHLTAHRITITSKQNIMTQKTPIPHPHFISASSIEENKPCSSLQLQFSSSPNYTPHNPLLSSVQSPVSPKLSNGFPCSQKSYEDHNFAYQRRHLCETAPVPPSFEEEVAQRVGFGQMTYIVSQSWLPHCIGQIAMSIEFQLRETIHKRPSTSPHSSCLRCSHLQPWSAKYIVRHIDFSLHVSTTAMQRRCPAALEIHIRRKRCFLAVIGREGLSTNARGSAKRTSRGG